MSSVNYLVQDELKYELQIRGIVEEDTVEKMRSTLRRILKLEKRGEGLSYPEYNLDITAEFASVEEKISEIDKLIQELNSDECSGAYKKVAAKLEHTRMRINRTKPSDNEEKKKRSSLLTLVLELDSKLERRLKKIKAEKFATLHPSMVTAIESGTESEPDEPFISGHNIASSSILQPPATHSEVKPVPVMKWGIKFNGKTKEMSVAAFIERIEELCESRNISKTQLFASAYDLFTGPARIWFKGNKKNFSTWDDVIKGLKQQFQPPRYDNHLFEEIKDREQGEEESVGIYFAVMENLFARLSIKVPEVTKLEILRDNIQEYYRDKLALQDILSVEKLKEYCLKLEVNRHSKKTFSGRRRNLTLEPDLAYVADNNTTRKIEEKTLIASIRCWNCENMGHRAVNCTKPKKMHCYRCGTPNVTSKTCMKCKRSQENYQSSH